MLVVGYMRHEWSPKAFIFFYGKRLVLLIAPAMADLILESLYFKICLSYQSEQVYYALTKKSGIT